MRLKTLAIACGLLLALCVPFANAQDKGKSGDAKSAKHDAAWYKKHGNAKRDAAWYKKHGNPDKHDAAWFKKHGNKDAAWNKKHDAAWNKKHDAAWNKKHGKKG